MPIWKYSARAIQWVPTWQGLDGSQKSLHPCAFGKSSLSIRKANSGELLFLCHPAVIYSACWRSVLSKCLDSTISHIFGSISYWTWLVWYCVFYSSLVFYFESLSEWNDAYENKFCIWQDFQRYLKKNCWLGFDQYCFRYFPKFTSIMKLSLKFVDFRKYFLEALVGRTGSEAAISS